MNKDQYPMRAVANLNRIWHRVIEKEMADINLSSIQSRMLGYLYYQSTCGKKVFQRELEEEFKIRRSSITSVLQILEKKGLVKRIGVEGDARRKELILTETGMSVQQTVLERLDRLEGMIEGILDPEELDTFLDCIYKIETRLKEAEDD